METKITKKQTVPALQTYEILTQAPLFQLSIFSSGSSVVTIPNKTICHVTVSRIDAKAYRSLTFSPLFQYNWGQFFSVISPTIFLRSQLLRFTLKI